MTVDVLSACKPNFSPDDIIAIERFLTVGCPVNFSWGETAVNKEMFVQCGNHSNGTINSPITMRTLTKEEHNSNDLCYLH